MKRRLWSIPLVACLLFSGCDAKKSPATPESEESAEVAGVTYKEGLGLKFLPETAKSIGLKTETVEERAVPRSVEVRAQVLEEGTPAKLTASVPESDAAWMEKSLPSGVVSLSVDRADMKVSGVAELTFTMNLPKAVRGDSITIRLTSASSDPVTSVPSKAVLRCASGSFVYVRNGDHYMKTAVKTGAAFGDHVEITDGLYSGDIVVTDPAEQLWLIELRIVKGGAGCC